MFEHYITQHVSTESPKKLKITPCILFENEFRRSLPFVKLLCDKMNMWKLAANFAYWWILFLIWVRAEQTGHKRASQILSSSYLLQLCYADFFFFWDSFLIAWHWWNYYSCVIKKGMECALGFTRAKICLSLQRCMSASMLMAVQKVAEKYEKTQKWKHVWASVDACGHACPRRNEHIQETKKHHV